MNRLTSILQKKWTAPQEWILDHPRFTTLLIYLACVIAASLIAFLRFPNNVLEPNFYAEDGRDFVANILDHGFLEALFTPFNGYFIVGLYLITGAGLAFNNLFGGTILTAPEALAIASYIFFGAAASLPALLFRRRFAFPYLLLLVTLSSLVPLRQSDYAILGTIGNLKWIFIYVAFLCIIYRNTQIKAGWIKLVSIDLAILICAYTNATVYFLMPLALWPYIKLFPPSFASIRSTIRLPSFISLFALGLLLIPQLVFVMINGIPELPGYLDTPFKLSRTIEVFIGRPYLYGLTLPFYHFLRDISALLIFVALIVALLWFSGRTYRFTVAAGLYTIFIATALFVVNRPGISDHFFGYRNSPDQFFYPQNLVCYFITLLVMSHLSLRFGRIVTWVVPTIILTLVVLHYDAFGSWGKNDFMSNGVGTFKSNAITACRIQSSNRITVPIYPVKGWDIELSRDEVCSTTNNP